LWCELDVTGEFVPVSAAAPATDEVPTIGVDLVTEEEKVVVGRGDDDKPELVRETLVEDALDELIEPKAADEYVEDAEEPARPDDAGAEVDNEFESADADWSVPEDAVVSAELED
jgi:hypothetical protein